LKKPSVNVVDSHSMDQVLQFGCVALTVCNDISFAIARSAPEFVGILSVYLLMSMVMVGACVRMMDQAMSRGCCCGSVEVGGMSLHS
jgi:hypothetical protein